MSLFSADSRIRQDLANILDEDSRRHTVELNCIIEFLNDCVGEYAEEEQPEAAIALLEQIREDTSYIEGRIRFLIGCSMCGSMRELQEGLCADCTKNEQQKAEQNG